MLEHSVLQEGEEGTWLGILLRGSMEVQVNGVVVHQLKPGDVLGEMILWFGGKRQATVVSSTPGVIATILVDELEELALVEPAMCLQLMRVFGTTYAARVEHALSNPG